MGAAAKLLKAAAFIVIAAALAALAAWWAGWNPFGQKLPGRVTDYHQTYDRLWEVACDTAPDGSDARCYVQYVDVYRPRPEFAAAMVEVVMHEGESGRPEPHVRFDIEPGLSFRDAALTIETANGTVALDLSDCPGNTCRFVGTAGVDVLAVLKGGTALELKIDEDRAEPAVLTWPLGSMADVLDDFAAQRRARNLP